MGMLDPVYGIGQKADAAAATDTGTFSLIALFKRLLGKVPVQGAAASAAAVPVVLATDDAQIGVKITGSAGIGAGGAGLVGWLCAIRDALLGTLTVSGTDAAGSAPTAAPLSVSGVDGGGLKRHILTETSGAQSVASAPRTVFTATIANGASLSGAVDLGNGTLARIGCPAVVTVNTDATFSFQTSTDGVTWKDYYDEYGNEVTIAPGKVAASRSFNAPLATFASVRYLKLRTGKSATPQLQGQSTDFSLTTVA
jgi:hypothetical protein